MFAYCLNNPINYIDLSGTVPFDVFPICFGDSSGRPNYLRKAYEVGQRSSISEGTISIDMDKETEVIQSLSDQLGLQAVCDAIANGACDAYCNMYGREFLLSELCVSYEIEAHIIAYYWSTRERCMPNYLVVGYVVKQIFGKKSYTPNSVYEATKSIDMRESDVAPGNMQSLAFGYRNGMRDMYVGSFRDPWADLR